MTKVIRGPGELWDTCNTVQRLSWLQRAGISSTEAAQYLGASYYSLPMIVIAKLQRVQ